MRELFYFSIVFLGVLLIFNKLNNWSQKFFAQLSCPPLATFTSIRSNDSIKMHSSCAGKQFEFWWYRQVWLLSPHKSSWDKGCLYVTRIFIMLKNSFSFSVKLVGLPTLLVCLFSMQFRSVPNAIPLFFATLLMLVPFLTLKIACFMCHHWNLDISVHQGAF